jgi:hypothetical protein
MKSLVCHLIVSYCSGARARAILLLQKGVGENRFMSVSCYLFFNNKNQVWY